MTFLKSILLIVLAVILGGTSAFFAYTYSHPVHTPRSDNRKPFLGFPIAKTISDISSSLTNQSPTPKDSGKDFSTVWFTDYSGNRVAAVDRISGKVTWQQTFSFPSVQDSGQPSNVEFMTIAPNGNPMVTTANGMLIQELDRANHEVVWQYGVLNQQYCNTCLHQPKKAYLFNSGTEVLVTDANNRRVVIINKATKKIVWEYGHKAEMRDAPGYLKGNRFAMPLDDQGSTILISDTLTNKIIVVDRATKNILWQWVDQDGKWLQNVFPTQDGTFIAEDHLKNEVFAVSKDEHIVWTLHQLADGTTLNYPADAITLGNGNVLIAEGGRHRIIEVDPKTGQIVWQYKNAGLVTSIAIEY